MILKNWYKLMANYMANAQHHKVVNINGKECDGVNYSEVFRYTYSSSAYAYPYIGNLRTSTTGEGGAILGTGTTPPTFDDYYLSGDLITTYTYSRSVTKTKTENGFTVSALYTITNTGSDAFTIGEIGLIVAGANSTSYAGADYKVMLERTVLDSPVTIPAGGVGQITYSITHQFPTAI